MFWKKRPKRLYVPTTSRWYTRPRYRPGSVSARKLPSRGLWTHISAFFKDRFRLLIGSVILIILAVILGSSSYFSIRSIQVLREDFNINSAAIENELTIYLGKSILFLPGRQIVKTIQEKFPEFQLVEINKVFPNALKINLESYPLVANLRVYYVLPEAVKDNENSAESLKIHEAFQLNPERKKNSPKPIEQKSLLNFIGQAIFDQEENLELMTISIHGLTQPIEDRQIIISKNNMETIRQVLQYFTSNLNLSVAGLEYLPKAREIHIKTNKNLILWLTLEKDYQEQIDKLKIIYEPAELHKEEIRYIDLRVKEKVIYCPRHALCAR